MLLISLRLLSLVIDTVIANDYVLDAYWLSTLVPLPRPSYGLPGGQLELQFNASARQRGTGYAYGNVSFMRLALVNYWGCR